MAFGVGAGTLAALTWSWGVPRVQAAPMQEFRDAGLEPRVRKHRKDPKPAGCLLCVDTADVRVATVIAEPLEGPARSQSLLNVRRVPTKNGRPNTPVDQCR